MAGSCKKDELPPDEDNLLVRKEDTLKDYSPEVSFAITGRLLENKRIDCIEPQSLDSYRGTKCLTK